MLNKMNADICQSCERAVPIAEMSEDGCCAACVKARKPRFQPYGGAGPLPTECCDFAVVDNSTGKEVCRVWNLEDARKIAFLLETPTIQRTTSMANRILDALEAAELVAKGEADLWEARRFREAADGMEALAKKHETKRQWADQMKIKIRALADTI